MSERSEEYNEEGILLKRMLKSIWKLIVNAKNVYQTIKISVVPTSRTASGRTEWKK